MASNIPEKIGRYQILERVGKGGMGVLYRGVDPVLDREVAIKVMLVDLSDDTEQMRPRFYREAQAAARLQHPNIVTIFEFAEDHNMPYIVMEFLRGTPLDARLASPIPLTLDDKLNVVAQLCSALNYAHAQGIVHRDIKPANIFVLPDGSVKLLDFGVAKLTSSTLTRQGDVLGSVSYMSPEQLSGSDSIDGRSDIFSVGVMLYEMLGGRKPFKGDSPTTTIVQILRETPPALDSLVAGLPTQLIAVVAKALAKDPSDRYANAGELARDLQLIRRNLAVTQEGADFDETRFASPAELKVLQQQLELDASSRPPAPPAPAPARRWTVPLVAAAVVMIGVAAVVVGNRRDGGGTPAATTTVPTTPGGAPAPPVTSRVIRIESSPQGAEVALDGKPTGEMTPAPLTLSGPGPFSLRLSKRGFVAQEVRLTEADLARGSATYTLAAAEVARVPVTIASAYPVEVLSGSQTLARASASHQLSVPAGTRLRVVARDLLLDHPLSVGPRPMTYNTPSVGRLTVLTRYETCNVKVGDRILGFPPITRKEVAAGQYRVDIVCQGGVSPPGQFVTVSPNETATVKVQ